MLLANAISRREIARSRAARWRHAAPTEVVEAHAMKLTLNQTDDRRMTHSLYVDEARMEPLNLGVLAALTPEDVDVVMYDDRMEPIPYHQPTDLSPSRSRPIRRGRLLRDRRRISPPWCACGDGRLSADLCAGANARPMPIRSRG